MFEKIEVPYNVSNSQNTLGNNGYFDPKMGTVGAVLMGSAVFYVNSKYGIDTALITTGKQAVYTFFVGGFMVRICENVATYFESPKVSKVMSILVPSALTLGLTYFVHSMEGTTEPLESTIPTFLLAPPSFAFWGHKKRNQLENLLNEQNIKKNI
jgi:hypothetical protein